MDELEIKIVLSYKIPEKGLTIFRCFILALAKDGELIALHHG